MKSDKGIVDLLVIGGGTAGIVGATTAAALGASTVLVERDRTGGDCLWTGCIPSKAILAAAKRAKLAQELIGGIPEQEMTGDMPGLTRNRNHQSGFAAAREHVRSAISIIEPVDSPAALEKAGVNVRKGSAKFIAPGVAEIDGETIAFRQALIASGAEPASPPIPGLAEATTVTSETIWELEEAPARLLVVGGGPVACELAQAFARFGSKVTVLARSQMLPKEDRDAAAVVRQSMEADGVQFFENSPVERFSATDGVSRAGLADGSQHDGDVVLIAAGRRPRTEGLGLETVGVDCDDTGHVIADVKMRSSNPAIWAAGDVTANPQFTHLAGVSASAAAFNAILGLGRSVSTVVPRVTYTAPEIAAVGITSAGQGRYRVSTIQHRELDRAITEGTPDGLTRLIIGKGGRIVGGTIVGPRAGESLAELTIAVEKGLSTRELAGVTHPYPTYNDGVWNAAIADARSMLASPAAKTVLKVLVRARRWLLDRRQGRKTDS
ncbi:dihydrolipoyl dehydrogenase family protein [Arthrobacter sp. H14]|uniref:dihydrolipoyl dehydrogenase family protein n=1 Tax=Arthrobacter sp. H14 TaxID=1312959 RepID=UPI0004798FB2|nr:NAD(P)/FAD-dependent oxidoreductase [Arthrobacter sp. H14]